MLGAIRSLGLPMNRQTYLDLAYPEGVPSPWTMELEMGLPPQFRNRST